MWEAKDGFSYLDEGGILIFDGTKYNYGSGYSIFTGKFLTPITGLYPVTVHLTARNGDPEHYLRVDGKRVLLSNEHDFNNSNDNDIIVGSTEITLELDKGQELWVKPHLTQLRGYKSGHGMFSWFGATLLANSS